MKNTFKLLSAFIFASLIALTSSCSKDDATATTVDATSITLTDSLIKNEIGNKNPMAYLLINIKLATGTTVKTAKLERKIGTGASEVLIENNRIDTVSDFTLSDLFTDETITNNLAMGTKVVYTATITDSKSKTATGSLTYTVVRGNGILISEIIELGAQSDTIREYKFLGLANSFATYTAGDKGTARTNSDKIDFVYYYGQNDKNTLASPSNTDGAQIIWGSEITSWTTKNVTLFSTNAITATTFETIKASKVDDGFYNIDFTKNTTEKYVNFGINKVVAFKTASGKIGLAKFLQGATTDSGSMKVQIICQD
jgi:hypothetical protein